MPIIVVYVVLLIALTPPLGAYMHRVYTRERIGCAEGLVHQPRVLRDWYRFGGAGTSSIDPASPVYETITEGRSATTTAGPGSGSPRPGRV